MAKIKNKRKVVADKVRKSRSAKPVKAPSAFDLHINKQKHNVMGRNQNIRGEVGNPVQSRSKAFKHRQKTLLKEYRDSRKSNVFKDMRVGESTDRLAMERRSEHEKLFSQAGDDGEEEELTHLGQSVSEIEKFDDDLGSDSDDEDGRLGGEVAKEFFGGYLTERDQEKSWKERMSELISKSRKEKYDRQSEKDKIQKKIEEVDEEFKSIHHLLFKTKRPSGAEKEKPKPDEFDIKVRMQQFEIKGTPSNKLKSEEEIAKEEAERLAKLEEDRKRRMKGELVLQEAPKHMSADSLDDGYGIFTAPTTSAPDEAESSDGDGDDDADDGDGEENGGEQQEEETSDEDDDEDAETDNSDLEEDSDEDEEEAEKVVEELLKKKLEGKKSPAKASSSSKTTTPAVDPEEQKKAASEIPYTFTAPKDLQALTSLLSPYSPQDQVTVVERLVACHHPSLAEGNKDKLTLLFSLLMQYLLDQLTQSSSGGLQLVDNLTPLLHQLLRHEPDASSATVLSMVLARDAEFQQMCQRRGGRGCNMGLDTLVLLKVVHALFPTSDFMHPVVTPAFHLLTTMLGQSPVQRGRDVASGLYLCTLCLQYVTLSKRYVPEVINFLHGVLFLAATKNAKKVEKVCPPFRPVGKFIDLLKLTGKVEKDVGMLSLKRTLGANQQEDLDTDEFRACCVRTCVMLLQEFAELYKDLASAPVIFSPFLDMLPKLPTSLYPSHVQEAIDKLKSTLEASGEKPLEALTMQKEKVQPLKMIDPVVEDTFDGRKKRKGTREQLERQRLKHKIKKEFKGALREIRKDSSFLANQKMEDVKKKDADRQKKLKRIYADLSNQEGEVRALKRQKNRE